MAKSKKESAKVTRIKASEATKASKVAKKLPTAKAPKFNINLPKPIRSIGQYFKGAWYELRQVRWPNRRATWGLTGAVLVFSAFFVVMILLLDVLFKFLFEQILG